MNTIRNMVLLTLICFVPIVNTAPIPPKTTPHKARPAYQLLVSLTRTLNRCTQRIAAALQKLPLNLVFSFFVCLLYTFLQKKSSPHHTKKALPLDSQQLSFISKPDSTTPHPPRTHHITKTASAVLASFLGLGGIWGSLKLFKKNKQPEALDQDTQDLVEGLTSDQDTQDLVEGLKSLPHTLQSTIVSFVMKYRQTHVQYASKDPVVASIDLHKGSKYIEFKDALAFIDDYTIRFLKYEKQPFFACFTPNYFFLKQLPCQDPRPSPDLLPTPCWGRRIEEIGFQHFYIPSMITFRPDEPKTATECEGWRRSEPEKMERSLEFLDSYSIGYDSQLPLLCTRAPEEQKISIYKSFYDHAGDVYEAGPCVPRDSWYTYRASNGDESAFHHGLRRVLPPDSDGPQPAIWLIPFRNFIAIYEERIKEPKSHQNLEGLSHHHHPEIPLVVRSRNGTAHELIQLVQAENEIYSVTAPPTDQEYIRSCQQQISKFTDPDEDSSLKEWDRDNRFFERSLHVFKSPYEHEPKLGLHAFAFNFDRNRACYNCSRKVSLSGRCADFNSRKTVSRDQIVGRRYHPANFAGTIELKHQPRLPVYGSPIETNLVLDPEPIECILYEKIPKGHDPKKDPDPLADLYKEPSFPLLPVLPWKPDPLEVTHLSNPLPPLPPSKLEITF